jgi:SAM-dependent methyltransferase
MDEMPRRLTFGAHADEYDLARPEWPAEVARWFVPDDASFVVELGAGTGKLTRALAEVVPRVLAVEPDARMRDVLEGHGLEGVDGSAEEIPCGDGEAEAVVAGSCVHWFDLERALPEIHRVLRPGGRFAFGWNGRDGRHPAIERMNETSFPPPPWRDRDWAAAVTAAGLFGDLEQATFEHVHELPRDALEAHLLSYSAIASLPEPQRVQVFAEVAEILDSDPEVSAGGRLRLPFAVTAYRAVRI